MRLASCGSSVISRALALGCPSRWMKSSDGGKQLRGCSGLSAFYCEAVEINYSVRLLWDHGIRLCAIDP